MTHLRRDTCDFDDLVERAGKLSTSVSEARLEARSKAVAVLRSLEEATRAALDGDVLRGMRSLLPPDCLAFQAAAVHGTREHGVDSFLAANGRPMLVWTKHGELHSAWKISREAVSRAVTDDELTAQDLEPATFALETVLVRHLEHSEETLKSYREVSALCARIVAALND